MNESLIGRSVAELRAAVREADRAETRARMRKLALFAELDQRSTFDQRGIFDQRGPDSIRLRRLVDLIQLDLNCTRSQAKALVTEVERFAGRISVTGEPLEPIYPVTAEALSAGQLTFAHAAVIADLIDKLPAELRAEHAVAVERKLVILAAEHDPKALHTLADRIVALLDPDGPEPRDDVQHRHRRLRLLINPHGSGTIDGQLTATAVAVWQVVLGSLAAQRDTRRDKDGNPVACTGELGPGELGPDELGPDTRTLWQRHHDAFEQAGRRLLKTGTLPDHAGLPAQLVITIDLRDLESRAGRATTHHGGTLTVQQALQLAAEATVIPVILDQQLGLLQHGRGKRLASSIQRKILFACDRGCTFPGCAFPGCAKPAAESEVHHLRDWLKFGPTDPTTSQLPAGITTMRRPGKAGQPVFRRESRTGRHQMARSRTETQTQLGSPPANYCGQASDRAIS